MARSSARRDPGPKSVGTKISCETIAAIPCPLCDPGPVSAVPSCMRARCGTGGRRTPAASKQLAAAAEALRSIDIIANNNIDQKVVEISSLQHYALVENSIDHSIFLLKAYTMMFSYHQVKERPKLLLAMTGLNHAEFAQLLPHFQSALDQYVQHNYIDRDNRQRQYGGGQPESTLVNVEDKLLFILYYFKVYPLQEILDFEFV